MLHVHGIGNHGAVHGANAAEHVAALVNGRCTLGAAEHEVGDVGRQVAGQLVLLVPVLAVGALRVPEKERLHVGGGGELAYHCLHVVAGLLDVGLGRNDLINHILDIAARGLIVILLVCVVVCLDLGVGHLDRAVAVVERNHHVVNLGRGVGLGYQTVGHDLGEIRGVGEHCAVLVVELLRHHSVLEIVPVHLQTTRLVGGDIVLHEVAEKVGGISTGLIGERGILGKHRGDAVAGGKVNDLVGTDADTSSLCVLDEHIPVKIVLPCSVADLQLALLVLGGRAGGYLMDGGELVHVLLEIGVGYTLAGNLADVVLGRHRVQSRLQGVWIDDKRQEGQGDDNGYRQTEFYANFLKNRHCVIYFLVFNQK